MDNDKFEYVFENSEFLVSDANQENLSTDEYGEVVYASGSQTILLHNGEYYIQTDGDTLLLGNDQDGSNQLVINENIDTESSLPEQSEDDNVIQYIEEGESCEPIIYKFIQNDVSFDSNDETEADEPAEKKIKLESQLVELDEGESVNFDVEKHLRILEEQEGLTGSRFQYAVIKDGKLHLQLCDTDSIEILKRLADNDDSLQASPELQELCAPVIETASIVDLSKVTGRNLITGQTVMLDDYLERIHNKIAGVTESELRRPVANKTFLNRKFTIGKTITGKRLVGKILQIKMGSNIADNVEQEKVPDVVEAFDAPEPIVIAENETEKSWKLDESASKFVGEIFSVNPENNEEKKDQPAVVPETSPEQNELENSVQCNVNVQELIFDSTGKILKVSDARELQFNEGVTTEHLEFLSKTLSGLADMDSIRKKILDKELRIKFIEKRFENKTQNFRKVVTHLKGHLDLQVQADSGAQTKNDYVFILNNDIPDESFNVVELDAGQRQKKRLDNWTSLSVVITQDRTRHKTTRVNFYEKTDNSSVCKICNREFKSLGHLNRHHSTSHSDKILTCHVCQVKFGDHALLNKHRRHHEHYFVCSTCGKNFTTPSSLRRHLSVHDHSLRPLECTICNARFTDESSLCKHLIIHTGIRAYHCTTCQKAFTTVGDLNFHRRVHDPVKLFYCEVCGREFSRHSNLLRHAEIHKGSGELYKCGVCGCSYKFISSLTRHVVQNHMAST